MTEIIKAIRSDTEFFDYFKVDGDTWHIHSPLTDKIKKKRDDFKKETGRERLAQMIYREIAIGDCPLCGRRRTNDFLLSTSNRPEYGICKTGICEQCKFQWCLNCGMPYENHNFIHDPFFCKDCEKEDDPTCQLKICRCSLRHIKASIEDIESAIKKVRSNAKINREWLEKNEKIRERLKRLLLEE